MEAYGIQSRVLSGDEVRNLDPSIGPQVLGAVQYSIDGRLNPLAFMEWLSREAKNKGVHFRTGTEVFGFEKTRRRIEKIYTTRGNFKAEQVVLAAGAWTGLLSKKLGLRLPIQGAKGYSLTFRRPPDSPRIPIILQESHIAMTPLEKSFRITGALELSGLNGGIDLKRIKTIQYHANAYVPQLKKMNLMEIWRGFRPCTPDGLPIIGKAEPFNNLWIASGHATRGMTLGPVTGKLMGSVLAGKSIGAIAQALSIKRF
jgi:D-amino-acid dehydrogenase